MLKEILGVADDPPARRRWFHDDYFDLFVWQAEGQVTLFQLCYGVDSSDRALVWDKSRGFFHDGPPAPDEVVTRFDDAANYGSTFWPSPQSWPRGRMSRG